MSRLKITDINWALDKLRGLGLEPKEQMRTEISEWWSWYDCSNPFYDKPKYDVRNPTTHIERMSLRPARMVCDEYASLLMADKTEIKISDNAMAEWCARDLEGIIDENAWLVSRAFAVGTAAMIANLYQDESGAWRCCMRGYDVRSLIVLSSNGRECRELAAISKVCVEGRECDQIQAIVFDLETRSYHIHTHLYDTSGKREELQFESVIPDFDTHSSLPPFALLTPSISNTYNEYSPLGVSIYDDAIDSIRNLDEAFTQSYWRLKLTTPRVFMRDSAVMRDPKTGEPKIGETVDQVLYNVVGGGVGDNSNPLTVYSPDPMVESSERALDDALSIMSLKCGLGANYFSFTRAAGLKTATEVVSDNSVLMRNVRKHERLIGSQIAAAVRGAYAAVLGQTHGGIVAESEVPSVELVWDDSTITDTDTERAMMKDDIARGLIPAHLYAMKYYDLTEEEAKDATGALITEAQIPLE